MTDKDNNEPGKTMARSPLLMNRDDSALIVVDVQEKLVPHIAGHERMVWNIGRLIDGAKVLGVRVLATEQYPKGLGTTIPVLSCKLSVPIPDKTMFSCRECAEIVDQLKAGAIYNVVLAGIETHVCVAQTALDLMSAGFNVFVCVDAIGSRFDVDRETAMRRMENSGVFPTTVEAVLFEWCEVAGSTEFKAISKLVQATGPQ